MARDKRKETPEALKKRTADISRLLRKAYPDPRTALHFTNPLELLMATILSAQSTDVRINLVTPDLFKKYKTARDYASADPTTLEQEIRTTGFFRQKTKALIATGKMLQERFGGQVPDNMDDLLSLPGVARKTANVVQGDAFGKTQGVVVDRHVARVAGRLALTAHTDPVKIEQDLMALLPRKDWIPFPHTLILHGRAICIARKPRCEQCVVNKLCPSAFTFGNKPK